MTPNRNVTIRCLCVVDENSLMVYDSYNQSYKLTNTMEVIESLVDTDQASSMAVIDKEHVAATIPNRQAIAVFKITRELVMELKKETLFPVSGKCQAIATLGRYMIVSFDEPNCKVQILDMQGNIKRSFATLNELVAPWFMSRDLVTRTTYISDWRKASIVAYDNDCNIKRVFQNNEILGLPFGIACDAANRNLYVCDFRKGNVCRVDVESGNVSCVLTAKEGVISAYCVALSMGKLYVCMQNCTTMRVYNIT